VNEWVGAKFAWVAVPIALLIFYEVISRRVFNNPHMWALDTATLFYAIHFMMVGAYGLLHNAHVNIDTIYCTPGAGRFDWQVTLPFFHVYLSNAERTAVESIQMGDRPSPSAIIVP
jgi:TRAP-type mannitol/chloroaromatic compound transport system permease small subunit